MISISYNCLIAVLFISIKIILNISNYTTNKLNAELLKFANKHLKTLIIHFIILCAMYFVFAIAI